MRVDWLREGVPEFVDLQKTSVLESVFDNSWSNSEDGS